MNLSSTGEFGKGVFHKLLQEYLIALDVPVLIFDSFA